jgi:peptidoglycan/LPS O-acetylase OafA/YrhL
MSRAREKLAFLDGLRGLAALYVLVGHARWLLWEGFYNGYKSHAAQYSLAGKCLVFGLSPFRWGHEAVIFFFVLSGFVIHLRYAAGIKNDPNYRFDTGSYFLRRARRLYPPLILALTITWGLDSLGLHLGLPTALHETQYPSINLNIGSDHSLKTLLCNLIFVMAPVFGSDGPLWSLTYEWYFYLLYPLVFLIDRRSIARASLALVALSVIGYAPIWPSPLFWLRGVSQLMIVWWFGALLADCFTKRLSVRYDALAALMFAPLVLGLGTWVAPWRDILMGLAFTGLIAACFALQERGRTLSFLTRLQPLGEMSYTLYVVHFPIVAFMSGCLMKASGGPLPAHFGWVGAAVLLSLGLAWPLHLIVERPFLARAAKPVAQPPRVTAKAA